MTKSGKKCDGLFEVYDDEAELYALLNSSGSKITEWYCSIDKFKNGVSIVTNKDDQYALINELGQVVSAWVEDTDELKANNSTPPPLPDVTDKTDSNTTTVDGFKTKFISNLSVSRTSINKDDFIEVLNTISPVLGGVTNLGVFCDINSIEQTSALLSDVEELFIHVDTESAEQPRNTLFNDGTSTNPYDFSFQHLLND